MSRNIVAQFNAGAVLNPATLVWNFPAEPALMEQFHQNLRRTEMQDQVGAHVSTTHGPVPEFGLERAEPGLHGSLIPAIRDVPRDGGVLDLGCGAGAWLRRLKYEGYTDLFGVERSGESASGDGLTIVHADLSERGVSLGRTFRLVTLIEVIEHLPNPGIVLETASRHLHSEGVLLITTPNIHSLIQRFKFAVTGRFLSFEPESGADPTHVQPLLLSSWKQMLPQYELTIERAWTFPATPFGLGAHPAWRFAARMAKPLLGDGLPGNSLCLRLRHISRPPAF